MILKSRKDFLNESIDNLFTNNVKNSETLDFYIEDIFFLWDETFDDERQGIEKYGISNGYEINYTIPKGISNEHLKEFKVNLEKILDEIGNNTSYTCILSDDNIIIKK